MLGITGDAMARPLADALEEIHDDVDLSSLVSIGSSAAIFSQSIKDQLMELLPNILVVDSIGATETGMNGIKIARRGRSPTAVPRPCKPSRDSIVVDDDLQLDRAGVREDRARRAHRQHPARLLQGPGAHRADVHRASTARATRSRATSRPSRRTARSRCSGAARSSINTGGEKVFPEEVEGVLKSHPDVFDVLVVGVPDERWGERVTAVVQAREGRAPTVEELDAHCRTQIAAYKAPKQVFLVDEISRAPSGKPDYPWAKEYARRAAAEQPRSSAG